MYVPEHFGYPPEELDALLARVRIADLVTVGPQGPEATVLPFVFRPDEGEHGVLRAHLSRVNDQWRHAGPALVVVHGPDGYVDPSDVPSPHAVPTWNYITVHVRGRLVAHDDPRWVRRAMVELVAAQASDFDFDTLSPRMLDGLVRSAVGVEVIVESIVGKAKMSQNRSSTDIAGIADSWSRRVEDPQQVFAGRCPAEGIGYLRNESLAHAIARERATEEIRERK
ncbi:transcriptional regulator [Propionibacterium cyclohexanicum]|uniref:Transcriptional regulator n=1 Tax=Propionibacterium cyclohexanicum TaxID=64702 RepID=A0A1H9Q1V9_9ACTN|nr:FMN-binding negative transcriptional regulator [Propionibacterium cyclohexanicum]SER54447.1 transcriptional regulator [Propionibacterium cyclohexanicum]